MFSVMCCVCGMDEWMRMGEMRGVARRVERRVKGGLSAVHLHGRITDRIFSQLCLSETEMLSVLFLVCLVSMHYSS